MGGSKGKRPGVMVYFDLRTSLKRFSLEEKGILFDAILSYAEDGDVPVFSGSLEVAWDFIQPRIDADAERYANVSKARSMAAKQSHVPGNISVANAANAANAANSKQIISSQHSLSQNKEREEDKPPRAPRFTPPSVEDVRTYCGETGCTLVDPEQFVDFYSTNGWMQGAGKKIKDWKACVRTWQRRGEKERADKPVTTGDRVYTAEDYRAGW